MATCIFHLHPKSVPHLRDSRHIYQLAKVILAKHSDRSVIYIRDIVACLMPEAILLTFTQRQQILLEVLIDSLLVLIAAALLELVVAIPKVVANTSVVNWAS
jgi:hypothetical protein